MYQPFTCYLELRRLQQGVGCGRREMHEVQRSLLRKLLAYAKRNCAYYRNHVKELDGPLSEPFDVLRRLPVLTKDILRSDLPGLQSERWRARIKRNTSGGSTGEPAVFYQDARYRRWSRAAKLLFDGWSGVDLRHRKAILWASSDGRKSTEVFTQLKAILRDEIRLNAYRMNEGSMASYLDTLERERPDQLLVYAESGYELARFALAAGRRLQGLSAVMSSAGTLYPDMRATMEKAFGAPVFDRYGSREVGDIACECPAHMGLHVNPFTHFVEIVRADGSEASPGELGRVLVTGLTNYAMPLIRYEIGDLATWAAEECTCGCRWPLLARVEGRVTDHVRAADGALVYGGKLRQLLFGMNHVKKYQWVQESLGEMRLLLVLDRGIAVGEGSWNEAMVQLEEEVRLALGAQCRLKVEILEEIPPSGSGKHRYIISKVA